MSRIIGAIAAVILMAIAGVLWSKFGPTKPEAAATVVEAATAAGAGLPMISPFDLMTKHGRNLRVEQWDAF